MITEPQLNLTWAKNQNRWHRLYNLDTWRIGEVIGVYVIWKADKVVRVGQGKISQRLYSHKNDNEIVAHGKGLMVSWATVNDSQHLDGIESFLADKYRPIVGERFPDKPRISCNLIE